MRSMLGILSISIVTLSVFGADVPTFTPEQDLKALQGSWKVDKVFWSDKAPEKLELNTEGTLVTFDKTSLICNEKTIATFTNDLPKDLPQHKEVGWEANRLVKLTLADGTSHWCSYRIDERGVQLTCPHSTSCHRGSGKIIYLQRVEK